MNKNTTRLKGKLIAVEGIDGSGKTTLLKPLSAILENNGYQVFITSWGSSEVIGSYINALSKKGKSLTHRAFATLYAADFILRYKTEILPELEKGTIVLCDRYYYTQLVRDYALGINEHWTRTLFENVIEPDLLIYMDISLATSSIRVQNRIDTAISKKEDVHAGSLMGSLLIGNTSFMNSKYREDGEPMKEEDKEQLMLAFQTKVVNAYKKLLAPLKNTVHIDGEKTEQVVLDSVYAIVKSSLRIGEKPPAQL